MNKQARSTFPAAAFLLITLLSAGTAAALNTHYGTGALASPSGDLDDSAFGFFGPFSKGGKRPKRTGGSNPLCSTNESLRTAGPASCPSRIAHSESTDAWGMGTKARP